MHFGSQLGIGNSLLCPFQSLSVSEDDGDRRSAFTFNLMKIMQLASQS
jgi:hypothetical protein